MNKILYTVTSLAVTLLLFVGCSPSYEDTTHRPESDPELLYIHVEPGVFTTSYGFKYVRSLNYQTYLEKQYHYENGAISYITVIIHSTDGVDAEDFTSATNEGLTSADFTKQGTEYIAVLTEGMEIASLMSMPMEEAFGIATMQYELLIS